MEAVVPKQNVRVLSKAFATLSKVSTDVVMEYAPDRFILRALAPSQSACAYFVFHASFFQQFRVYHADENTNNRTNHNRNRNIKIRVHSRLLMLPFRVMIGMDTLTLKITPSSSSLSSSLNSSMPSTTSQTSYVHPSFTITTASSSTHIVRTYKYNIEEPTEVLQADFSRQVCTTVVSAKSQSWNTWLQSFSPRLEELTLIISQDRLQLRSFHDPYSTNVSTNALKDDSMNVMQTAYDVGHDELTSCDIDEESLNQPFTFCLRELRAFVSLCEAFNQSLYIFAQQPGKPILITNIASPLPPTNFRSFAQSQSQVPSSVTSNTSYMLENADSGYSMGRSGNPNSGSEMMENRTDSPSWSAEIVIATLDLNDYSSQSQSSFPSQSTMPNSSRRGPNEENFAVVF